MAKHAARPVRPHVGRDRPPCPDEPAREGNDPMKLREAEALDRLLPLSAAETLFANRMIALSGCSAYVAAFEARQHTYRDAGHTLADAERCACYGRLNGVQPRRIPIRHLDRINIKRRARGLQPLRSIGQNDNAPHARLSHQLRRAA